jgi:hypothetical protein
VGGERDGEGEERKEEESFAHQEIPFSSLDEIRVTLAGEGVK